MKGSQIRKRLLSGERVYGTLLVSGSPFWPTVVDKIPGLDFVFIDTEHITIDDAMLSWMCRTYDAMGLAPIVRWEYNPGREDKWFVAIAYVDCKTCSLITTWNRTTCID